MLPVVVVFLVAIAQAGLVVRDQILVTHAAREAARRLPVSLLFPLVLTTLPAFVILTIVPLLVGSFRMLRL